MPKSANRPISLLTVVWLVTWIMPPHRQAWVHAMLNEAAYIETRQAVVRWMIGSLLFAIRERTNYELEKASMSTKTVGTVLILITMAIGLVAGTYAIQKPYQQERIKFAVHRLLDAKQT